MVNVPALIVGCGEVSEAEGQPDHQVVAIGVRADQLQDLQHFKVLTLFAYNILSIL